MPKTRRLPLSANRETSRVLDRIHTRRYDEVKRNLLKTITRNVELERQNNELERENERLTNLLRNRNSRIKSRSRRV